MIKLGYTIIYVPCVIESLEFFSNAFGFKQRFLFETGDYGELDTGDTVLAFAAHSLGCSNFPKGYQKASDSQIPLGMEIALVTDQVVDFHNKALKLGAVELSAPEKKPWGQTVSYIRCPAGTLIELCDPVAL